MAYRNVTGDGKRVLEDLRRAIITARRTPGARIIEREVAADLGVSRTPVREALSRLELEGLVTAIPGRQRTLLQIAPLTARELRQASAATSALEGIGAKEATSQRKADRLILARELDSLLESVAQEMTPEGGSFARALELDERFHRMLSDDYLEPSMAACLESARSHVYRYVWMFSPKTGVTAARFKSEHAPIVAALRKGDAAGIRTALEQNWSGVATRIAPFLEDAS